MKESFSQVEVGKFHLGKFYEISAIRLGWDVVTRTFASFEGYVSQNVSHTYNLKCGELSERVC